MGEEVRQTLKRRASELYEQHSPDKRRRYECSPQACRAESVPVFGSDSSAVLSVHSPWPGTSSRVEQSPSSSTALQQSEYSGQTRFGGHQPAGGSYWQAPLEDAMEDGQTSLERQEVSSFAEDESMDIEPSDAMQRSSSAPDLRVLIDGLKPRLPGTRMEGLALPQMSSLATALVPFKAPQEVIEDAVKFMLKQEIEQCLSGDTAMSADLQLEPIAEDYPSDNEDLRIDRMDTSL